MVFVPGSWLPPMPAIPDVSLPEFMFDEKYGRAPFATSLDPYQCGTSHRSIMATEQKDRVEILARAIAFDLGWGVNEGSEFDKVAGIFALNTIDIPTLHWAIHRLNGIVAPVNATYTADELAELLKRSKAKTLFTVLPLIKTAKTAAKYCGISFRNVYILDMPGDGEHSEGLTTISQLLTRGQRLSELEPARWARGQSARQIAYMSHSSGTSGPAKMTLVTHQNIIANVIQVNLFDLKTRGGHDSRQLALGLLPFSHVYGIVLISHISTYRGDSVIVLSGFDIRRMLEAVQKWRINIFNVVPPMIVALGKSPDLLEQYDLSSIETVVTGGAPLDGSTLARLSNKHPHWRFRQCYGLTEAGAAITITSGHDPVLGSAGNVIPGVRVKLLREDGSEVTQYDEAGEVYAQSPGVIPGYRDDPVATSETFVEEQDGRWLRTGDIALFRQSPSGLEHIFIVDRIKEVIKVKGLQVVPAELEACLLTHPAVTECAVIGVRDEWAGEIPKAFVQRSTTARTDIIDEVLAYELSKSIQTQKAKHKWLAGGIVFVESIPKSPSGKILRRLLRDQDKQKEKHRVSRL